MANDQNEISERKTVINKLKEKLGTIVEDGC